MAEDEQIKLVDYFPRNISNTFVSYEGKNECSSRFWKIETFRDFIWSCSKWNCNRRVRTNIFLLDFIFPCSTSVADNEKNSKKTFFFAKRHSKTEDKPTSNVVGFGSLVSNKFVLHTYFNSHTNVLVSICQTTWHTAHVDRYHRRFGSWCCSTSHNCCLWKSCQNLHRSNYSVMFIKLYITCY